MLYLLLNSCATYPSVSRSLPYFSPIQNRIAPVAYCLPQLLWFLLLPFLLPFHRTLTNLILIESDNKFHFFPSILSPFKSLWTLLSSYRKNLRTLSYFTAWHWPVLQSFLVFFPPSLTTLTSIYHKHHHIHFCNEDWEDERLFLVLWPSPVWHLYSLRNARCFLKGRHWEIEKGIVDLGWLCQNAFQKEM